MLRDVKIVVYQQGQETTISPQSSYFFKLQQKCEEFLSSADDVMRDFITEEKVSSIKNEELAIEVVYQKPKEIKIHRFNKVLKANYILIPLTRNYATLEDKIKTQIFFYGPGYGPDYIGPHWTTKDVMEIKELLRLAGVAINQKKDK